MRNSRVGMTIVLALAFAVGGRSVEAQVDPCAFLTVAEVSQALPGSKPGKIDRDLEKAGILRCSWESPAGRLFLIASKEPEDSARAEATGWVEGVVDPLREDAKRRVRFDVIPGIADEAIAVVERQDAANGILQDAAMIVVRRGTWQVSLLAPQLARRERAEAVRALTQLAKALVARLK